MESIEQAVFRVLVDRLCEAGLISKSTCTRAKELVHSVMALPEFFRYSDVLKQNVLSQEAMTNEYSEDPQ